MNPITRLRNFHNRKRYVQPDRMWRRPFRQFRYRVGMAFLKPYLVRQGAVLAKRRTAVEYISRVPMPGEVLSQRELEYRRRNDSRRSFLDGQVQSYRGLTNLESEALYGDDLVLNSFSHKSGWPNRFHLFTPIPLKRISEEGLYA